MKYIKRFTSFFAVLSIMLLGIVRKFLLTFLVAPINLYLRYFAPTYNKIRKKLKFRSKFIIFVYKLYQKFKTFRKLIDLILKILKKTIILFTFPQNQKRFICIGSLGPGGAERQWANIAINLKIRGLKSQMVILNNLDESSKWILDDLETYKIKVTSISNFEPSFLLRIIPSFLFLFKCPSSTSFEYLFTWYKDNKEFRNAVKFFLLEQPTQVLVSLDYSNLIFGTAAIYSGVPDIRISMRSVAPNNYHLLDFTKGDWRQLYKDLYQNECVKWSANANHLNESYADYFGCELRRDVEVIKNVFYLSPFSQEKIKSHGPPCKCKKFHILGIMRLSEEKSPLSWLELAKYLELRNRNLFHFILVGNGIQKRIIKKNIDILRKYNFIIDFHEKIDFIFPYLLLWGAIVSSSVVEGHSNLNIEASHFNMKYIELFNQNKSTFEYNFADTASSAITLASFNQIFIQLVEHMDKVKTSDYESINSVRTSEMFTKLTNMVNTTLNLNI